MHIIVRSSRPTTASRRLLAALTAGALALGALWGAGIAPSFAAEPGEVLVVAPSGAAVEDGQYASVAAAIAAAEPGDTVQLLAGSYPAPIEFPVGTTGITLRGAGQGETVIVPSLPLFGDGGANASSRNAVIIRHTVTDVVIEQLTIDGAANSAFVAGAHFRDGIWWEGGTAAGQNGATQPSGILSTGITVRDVTVKNIDRRGISAYPENLTGTTIQRVTVDGVRGVQNTGSNGGFGIIVNGAGTITGSTVQNVRIGINGSSQAGVAHRLTVTDNTLRDFIGTTPTPGNIGINFWLKGADSSPVTITGNSVTSAAPHHRSLYVVDPGQDSTISNNTVVQTAATGTAIEVGWAKDNDVVIAGNTITVAAKTAGLVLTGSGAEGKPVQVKNNTITSTSTAGAQENDLALSQYDSSREVGIVLSGARATSWTGDASAPLHAAVTGNTVSGFTTALAIVSDAPNKLFVTVAENAFTRSTGAPVVVGELAASSPYAFAAAGESAPPVELGWNHWGSIDGAAEVSASPVSITPWYTDAARTSISEPAVRSLRISGNAAGVEASWQAVDEARIPAGYEVTGSIARLLAVDGSVVVTRSLDAQARSVSFTAPSKSQWYRIQIAAVLAKGDHAVEARATTLLARATSGLALSFYGNSEAAPVIGDRLEVLLAAEWRTPFPTSFAYTWYADGKAIKGATRSWFVPVAAQLGKTITVRVVAAPSKEQGHAAFALPVIAAPLSALSDPMITGDLVVGATLKVGGQSWSVSGVSQKYQWYADGAALKGATKNSYKLPASVLGKELSVRVTASRAGYAPATADATAEAAVLGKQAPTVPVVSGAARVGATLTASSSKIGAAEVSYQWGRLSGKTFTPIEDDAEGESYVVTPADLGATLAVRATWTRAGYLDAAATSKATKKVVVAAAVTAVTPAIVWGGGAGAPVGTPITISLEGWGPAGVVTAVQWHRDGAPIAGATGTGYTPVLRDLGKRLTVSVTGSLDGYSTVTRTSGAVYVVPAA